MSDCSRCDAEAVQAAAQVTAAYLANGYSRIRAAIRHEDELIEAVQDIIRRGLGSHELALLVIDAVREFDEHTLAMREAKDDHTAQNNERPY